MSVDYKKNSVTILALFLNSISNEEVLQAGYNYLVQDIFIFQYFRIRLSKPISRPSTPAWTG